MPRASAAGVDNPSDPQQGFMARMSVILTDAPFRKLLTAVLIIGIGSGMWNSTIILFLTYWAKLKTQAPTLIFIYLLFACVGTCVWVRLSKSISKHGAMVVAGFGTALGATGLYFAEPGQFWEYAAVYGFMGVMAPSIQILVTSIIADLVEIDARNTGIERAGLFFSFWSLFKKAADAIGIGVALNTLAWLGFRTEGVNSETGLQALMAFVVIAPQLMIVLGVLVVRNFPINASVTELAAIPGDDLVPRSDAKTG